MHLLLLEDDETVGDGLCAVLTRERHQVDWVRSLAQARTRMDTTHDALLIDWNLPDGSGIDWLRALRSRGVFTPAIVLTARDAVRDRITGLDSGADDFLVKPFDTEELSARLRALTRRLVAHATRRPFGEVQLDVVARAAWRGGLVVELTAREWALVEALALRAGRIVARSDLEAIVCGEDAALASNALEVHVSHVRSKLGRGFIETIRGLGYRLPAPG